MDIAERVRRVRDGVEAACRRAGRPAASVRIIGASKMQSAERVVEVAAAGIADFGENRIQEGLPKIAAVAARGFEPQWHFIGSLQTNKAGVAAEHFGILHSVDSVRLAKAIAAHARQPVRVLIEVNVAGEASKGGVHLDDPSQSFDEVLGSIQAMPMLSVIGLMTVAPIGTSAEDARPVFRQLAALAARHQLAELSMGMSDDFEVAIEEGATMVRIGRALFGDRQ